MRRSGWLLIAAFVVVSSMLMWACGGGGNKEPGAATEPVATSPAGETPEVGMTPQTGGDAGQFKELASQFKNATFKVTYKVSGSATREGVDGTMVWYKEGDNLRIDISGTLQGQRMNAVVIARPDQSYLCTETPGVGEGGTCYLAPGGPSQGADQIISGLEKALADPNVQVLGTETREIAGQAARCFTMQTSGSAGESEVCLSNEGVPLLSKAALAQGDMVLEATDYGRDVSESDFEPPYPVSEAVPSPSGQGQ
jgi:hypothetical protein